MHSNTSHYKDAGNSHSALSSKYELNESNEHYTVAKIMSLYVVKHIGHFELKVKV